MRVVYFGYPARSHTVPSLVLVRELVGRGVSVDYYSTERFRGLIEGAGARFVALSPGCEGLADPEGLEGPGLVVAHARRLVEAARLLAPQLTEQVGRPDLVVFDASAYWGGVVARSLGVPCSAFVTTFAFTRAMLALMGVADTDALDVLVPAAKLKIVCTSRFFQPSGRFFDDSHVFVGPLLEQRPEEGIRMAPEGARPLAYVSLGTIFNRDRGLLEEISGRLSGAGWQVVVALGDAGLEEGGAWPEGVRAYSFVNQVAALRLADVAVTHGGMASMSEIVAQRVPALVVPRAADQFLVARRCAGLGAAMVVSGGDSWDGAMAAVREGREAMVAAAGRIAESFADVTPMGDAADRVLRLVA